MGNLMNFFNLFRKGQAVKDAAAWKNGTIAVNSVAAFLAAAYATALGLGAQLPTFTDANFQVFATSLIAIVSAVNSVMHVVTSDKVGLPTKS